MVEWLITLTYLDCYIMGRGFEAGQVMAKMAVKDEAIHDPSLRTIQSKAIKRARTKISEKSSRRSLFNVQAVG